MLARENWQVETPYGLVSVKVGKLEKTIVNLAPEYEECQKIAQQYSLPLKMVLDLVKEAAYKRAGGGKKRDE